MKQTKLNLLKVKEKVPQSQSQSEADNCNEEEEEEENNNNKSRLIELGNNGSELVYIPRLIGYDESWKWFHYLDDSEVIPWTRPTIRVFGRSCVQPRDTCYIAAEGIPQLQYSGYKPHAHSWEDFPPLARLRDLVEKAVPGSRFNSLLLNRYKGGNDYVGWHSDDEKLYGPTPQIASLSFGCERDFLLKKKIKQQQEPINIDNQPIASKRLKRSTSPSPSPSKPKQPQQNYCFSLKHGSLLVMRGFTQRDWIHSVPKRAAKSAGAVRINLTFRLVL